MKTKARYRIEHMDLDVVVIRDIGHVDGMSITNDADNVIRALMPIVDGRELWYIDSSGVIDGLHCNPADNQRIYPIGRTYLFGTNRNGEHWIRCTVCNMQSYHPQDIRQRYCGQCHQFHQMIAMQRRIEVRS